MTNIYISQCYLFWNLFTSGVTKQTVICQQCNSVNTKIESFAELMLVFPSSHHSKQSKTCTLNDLFEHDILPIDVDYLCDCCKKRTIAKNHEEISVYPELLIIVLCRKIGQDEVNENSIQMVNTAVEFPLEDLRFPTVSNIQEQFMAPNCRWSNRGRKVHVQLFFLFFS